LKVSINILNLNVANVFYLCKVSSCNPINTPCKLPNVFKNSSELTVNIANVFYFLQATLVVPVLEGKDAGNTNLLSSVSCAGCKRNIVGLLQDVNQYLLNSVKIHL